MAPIPAPVRFPVRGERAIDTLLVGGGLHLASVFLPVIPLLVVLGYLVGLLATVGARDRAERFTWDRAAEGTTTVYRSVLDET